jgi:signal transduction histidine kinase
MGDLRLSPEILVPRLGGYLVEKSIITPEALNRALEYQEKLRSEGDFRLIGQVLVDLNIIDRDTRDAIITEIILQLRAALQEANQQLQQSNQQLEQRVEERTAELQQALAKLSELNQLKANIVANISHELRTPLTHLKGYVELLRAEDMGPLNAEQQSALGIIDKAGERLGRLIEDLILFSISERDQVHLTVAPFSVQRMCDSVFHQSQQKASEHRITLSRECGPDLPDVDGDEEKITWVVMQFLDNAIKFTQAGGAVTLRFARQGPEIVISVSDNGIGIPAARLDEVFDSFYQLDGSSTRKVGGTGLGLALAKKIVEAHGSTIRVTSEIGKGSCFSFSLKPHLAEFL